MDFVQSEPGLHKIPVTRNQLNNNKCSSMQHATLNNLIINVELHAATSDLWRSESSYPGPLSWRLQCQGHLPLTQYQENSHLQGPWPIPAAWCCFKSLQVLVQSSRPGIPFCYHRTPAVLVPAKGRQHWAMLILFFPGIIRIKSQYLSDISGTQSGVGTALELFWNQNLQSHCHTPNVFGTVDMEKVSWWTNAKNTHKIC